MTREEAKEFIAQSVKSDIDMALVADAINTLEQEPGNDMVSRGVFEQAMWERDVAIDQLKQLGYGLGEKIRISEDAVSRQAVLEQTYKWSKDELLRVTNPFDYLRKRINSLPPVNPQPKTGHWIPVSERMPENRNQEVLISLEWGIDIGRYSNGEWHSEWINHYDDRNVLAWMPLPEPYKAESEGKE